MKTAKPIEATSNNPKKANVKNTKNNNTKKKPFLQDLIETVVISGLLATFIIIFIAQSFVVQGSSMEPSFHNGERLLVNKFLYHFVAPKHGDVIVFKPEGEPKQRFIKRVIGLPGDTVTVLKGEVRVNGEPIKEKYIAVPVDEDYGTFVVPEKHVFVLGDNRLPGASADSRFSTPVGYVDYKSISGKAFVVYWPIFHTRWVQHPNYVQ